MEIILKKLEQLEVLFKTQNILSKEFLTLEEAAIYLGLSKSTLYKMTSKREIPFYNPGGKKIYLKRAEIDEWVSSGIVFTLYQMQLNIEKHLRNNNKSICK